MELSITQKEFDEIYKEYLSKKENNKSMSSLDLSGYTLNHCILRDIDLSHCKLSECKLIHCELYNVDLSYCDLSFTTFQSCNLTKVNAYKANLPKTVWELCKIDNSQIYYSNLVKSFWKMSFNTFNDFTSSNFTMSEFYKCCFTLNILNSVNMSEVDIDFCDFRHEYNMIHVINPPYFHIACPEEGAFIGWKCIESVQKLIKLEIPDDAKRLSCIQSRECRCDKAKVLGIYEYDGTKSNLTSILSDYDSNFCYSVGKTVEVDDFDDNIYKECSNGIHFFINRREAIEYSKYLYKLNLYY